MKKFILITAILLFAGSVVYGQSCGQAVRVGIPLNISSGTIVYFNSATSSSTIITFRSRLYDSTGKYIIAFSTDGSFSGNSDFEVPTEKAVKIYVDALGYDVGQATGALVIVDYNIGQATGVIVGRLDAHDTDIYNLQQSTGGFATDIYNLEQSTYSAVEKYAISQATGAHVEKAGDTMTGLLRVSSSTHVTGDAIILSDAYFDQDLIHYGNPLTKIRFGDDRIVIRAGNLSMIDGVESTTDTLFLGDGDWDYMIFGDTSTKVNLTTHTYSNGNWDLPANLNVRGSISSDVSYLTVDIDTSTVTSTAANVWRVVAGTYTVAINNGFTIQNAVSGSTFTYVGTETKVFQVNIGISASASGTNEDVHYRLAKNGTMIVRSEQHRRLSVASDVGSIPLPWQLSLATNDTFNLRIKTETGDTMTHEHLVITVMQIN